MPKDSSWVCAQKAPARLGFPGDLPQRRVVWMWFGAFPGAFVQCRKVKSESEVAQLCPILGKGLYVRACSVSSVCLTLLTLLTVAHQAPQFMGFSRHGRGSALPRLGAELELRRSGSSLGPSQ